MIYIVIENDFGRFKGLSSFVLFMHDVFQDRERDAMQPMYYTKDYLCSTDALLSQPMHPRGTLQISVPNTKILIVEGL